MNKNKDFGNEFESILKAQAQRNGLLIEKNHLTAKFLPGGRVKLQKSKLDFMIADQKGRVGCIDAKSFAGNSFNFSDITKHQLEKACLYNDYSIPSGFVVFFRDHKIVVFYSGKVILKSGPDTSLTAMDGLYLGKFWEFDLSLILL